MLSLLPQLLAFEQFTPLLLRLTIGIIFIYWAYKTWKNKTLSIDVVYSISSFVIGALFVVGLFVQLAAIVSIVYFGYEIIGKIRAKSFLTDGVNYYLILLVISICLLVSGAGIFAFDLPL